MPTRREFLAASAALASGGLRPPLAKARAADVAVTGAANPALAPFDDLLTGFLKDHAVPGAGVAVARNGRLVYARGFGHANVEADRPVEPLSEFRIASVSKPITAVGVLRLVDAGKVKLDDRVMKHLKFEVPAGGPFDKRWNDVTVRHCLHHTGGWDRGKKGGFDPIGTPWKITDALGLKRAPAADDVVRYMLGKPLDFEPGAKMAYSNLGYLVLGRVIEAVTGQKYEAWVRANVLKPVGAAAMRLGRGLPGDRPKGEVRYYDSKKRTAECLYPPRVRETVPLPDGGQNVEGFEAHGGWVASPVDLLRFTCAFDHGKKSPVLSEAAIEQMWARPDGPAGRDAEGEPRDAYYGCGWMVRPVGKSGKVTTWHNGLISGTSALLVRRSDGLNWAVLFNTDATAKGEQPASLIDGSMHTAADAVKTWPDTDLFERL